MVKPVQDASLSILTIPLQGSPVPPQRVDKNRQGMRGHYCVICVIFVQRKQFWLALRSALSYISPGTSGSLIVNSQPVQHSMTPHFLLIVNWLLHILIWFNLHRQPLMF